MRVLVVEDEINVQKLMSVHLSRERLDVVLCSNGKEAKDHLKNSAFDLIILDWMLPDISGIDLCKEFLGFAPILMVTARAEPSDIVLGLEMGADDYVTKPFEIPVFIARVRALLRRSQKAPSKDAPSTKEEMKLGNLSVNIPKVEVHCGKEEIKLTTSEFKLLVCLLQNQGKVLSRDKLKNYLQGDGTVVVDRVVDTHIYTLRGKLGKCADFIETIRGIGYRIKSA